MVVGSKGGATNLKVGGQCIGNWGVNYTVKHNILKKVGVHDPPPPALMVVPLLVVSTVLWHIIYPVRCLWTVREYVRLDYT